MHLPSIRGLLSLLAASTSLLATATHAESINQGPIKYYSLLENPRISTPSARIHAHTPFDITFSLHRGKQEIKLALHPNDDIYAYDGPIVNIYAEDGSIAETKTIKRADLRVFKGEAMVQDDDGWERVGYARVFVYDDGERPLFDGSFSMWGEVHHIQRKSRYVRTKSPEDVDIEEGGEDFMIVWRDSDMEVSPLKLQARDGMDSEHHKCAMEDLAFNMDSNHPIRKRSVKLMDQTGFQRLAERGMSPIHELAAMSGLHKRQIDTSVGGGFGSDRPLRETINSRTGCPSQRLVALIGIASDCTYAQDFDDAEEITRHLVSQLNQASAVFETAFNIALAARQVNIQPKNCPGTAPQAAPWNLPCSPSNGIFKRLNIFSQWRGTVKDDGNALWTLMTRCSDGEAVGLAWLGQLCRGEATTHVYEENGVRKQSIVSGANVVARTNTEWKVIAHEIGHTFGAVHDCTSADCRNQTYVNENKCCPRGVEVRDCPADRMFLMNPATDDNIENFSPCTVGGICAALGSRNVNSACLVNNREVPSLVQAVCGNGIVEKGEECDCGGPNKPECAANSCCDAATCKLKGNAVCDDSNEECCNQCQLRPSGHECRPSNGACDPAEYCTGTSATCPKDELASNGTPCGSESGLQCASGQCTSRNRQCQRILGGGARAHDSSSCAMTCRRSDQIGSYTITNYNFVDGTICNSDGQCRNGRCTGASALGGARAWINENRTVVIAVASVVGALILFSCLGCLCSRFGLRRKKRAPRAPRRGGNIIRLPSRNLGGPGGATFMGFRSNGIDPNQAGTPMAQQPPPLPLRPNPAARRSGMMGPAPQPYYYEPGFAGQESAARYG